MNENSIVKGAIRLGVGLALTWFSHLVWKVTTAKDAAFRWLVATFFAHIVLNQIGA